jgi:DNA-binding transcriptional ArsR family regulator
MATRSTKDVIAGGRLKRFMDRRLISALSHPLREHILAVVNERTASATEIGREIGLKVPAFYHHFEVLEELRFIEQVKTQRRRGARERFFQAREAILFDDRAWEVIPASVRADMTVSQIQAILDDVIKALRGGAFTSSAATHVTWLPGVFDRLGWREVLTLMNETLSRIMKIQQRSRKRIAVKGEVGIPATIALMGFRHVSPNAAPPGSPRR